MRRLRPRLALALVALAGLLGTLPLAASAAQDDLFFISRATGPSGAGGDDDSGNGAVSDDGRYVAFESEADNLSGDDNTDRVDVFRRDRVMNTTALVSRDASGTAGASFSRDPSISADGRYVAFTSNSNLDITISSNAVADIYVRDLQLNTTTLVSQQSASDGGASGDGNSESASISADGRYVAFESEATNLSDDDMSPDEDIYVRDLVSNTTTLVSRANGPSGSSADANAINPSISANGNRVAFHSTADNLSADDESSSDIFVRDISANTTTLVSRATGASGDAANAGSNTTPSISSGGNYVAFVTSASNLDSADTNGQTDVYLRDLSAETTTWVSGGGGSSRSYDGVVSGDGSYVAFTSFNTYGTDTGSGFVSVFHRDVSTGTTTLVSRADGPAGADGEGSADPTITSDGRFVAFESAADELSDEDVDNNGGFDSVQDVFLRDVLGAAADTTPPDTTITQGPTGTTSNPNPSFSFSSSESGSSFECRLDGPGSATGTFAACDSPKSYSGLANGDYTFRVRATDAAGNPDGSPATRSFTVAATSDDQGGGQTQQPSATPTCDGKDATIVAEAGKPTQGTGGDDVIVGTAGNDVIEGSDGNDVICGGGGDDTLRGQRGLDVVLGEDGADAVSGNDDVDTVRGGAGDDKVYGREGADKLSGNEGDDLVLGGDGDDTAYGRQGADAVRGGRGADTVLGDNGPDKLSGNDDDDLVRGGPGDDRVFGRRGNDRISGNAGDDLVRGNDGDDRVYGRTGDDRVSGDAGKDIVRGGPGKDTFLDKQ